jgi:hypothetical protein
LRVFSAIFAGDFLTLHKMKAYCFLLGVLLGAYPSLYAQDVVWKAGVRSFFDNTEFGGSSVQTPQTMAGVRLAPEIGLGVDGGKHRVFAGVDLLHEYGSTKAVDFYAPILYYAYASAPFRFYAGAIPRRLVLEKYPRMFFQDSILHYRPTINGIFWEYSVNRNYANLWLDWTGRQTSRRREAFFMGWSGRYNRGIFYARHFGYMFHFAKTTEPGTSEFIHDNGLILTSLGIDLAGKTAFEQLETNLGWSMAFDRDRGIGVWNKPQGILSETRIAYKGIGLFNTYYRGGSQQVYANEFGSQLYWGDPVYRSKEYNRADLYIYFIRTDAVKLKFVYSLHFMEKRLYHQQAFYATFNLDNLKPKTPNRHSP